MRIDKDYQSVISEHGTETWYPWVRRLRLVIWAELVLIIVSLVVLACTPFIIQGVDEELRREIKRTLPTGSTDDTVFNWLAGENIEYEDAQTAEFFDALAGRNISPDSSVIHASTIERRFEGFYTEKYVDLYFVFDDQHLLSEVIMIGKRIPLEITTPVEKR